MPLSARDDHGCYILCFFLIVLIACWVVAASLVAEQTNAGVALLQIPHLYVVSDRMEMLFCFLCARLSAAAIISLSCLVSMCCYRALLHFVRSATRPSQDIGVDVDSLHISYADILYCRRGRPVVLLPNASSP